MGKYKGTITFGDKEYICEVIDGVRYIDGKPLDEFLDTLDVEYLTILEEKGWNYLTGNEIKH